MMDEGTDPRITRPSSRHVPLEESYEEVAQIIDLRALEARAAGYRGDDIETDRSKTAVYVRAQSRADTLLALPSSSSSTKPSSDRVTRPATPARTERKDRSGPTIRTQRKTQRLVLPAIGARGFAELEPTELIPRFRPLGWPSPSMWALLGMGVITLLSIGACAALLLIRG